MSCRLLALLTPYKISLPPLEGEMSNTYWSTNPVVCDGEDPAGFRVCGGPPTTQALRPRYQSPFQPLRCLEDIEGYPIPQVTHVPCPMKQRPIGYYTYGPLLNRSILMGERLESYQVLYSSRNGCLGVPGEIDRLVGYPPTVILPINGSVYYLDSPTVMGDLPYVRMVQAFPLNVGILRAVEQRLWDHALGKQPHKPPLILNWGSHKQTKAVDPLANGGMTFRYTESSIGLRVHVVHTVVYAGKRGASGDLQPPIPIREIKLVVAIASHPCPRLPPSAGSVALYLSGTKWLVRYLGTICTEPCSYIIAIIPLLGLWNLVSDLVNSTSQAIDLEVTHNSSNQTSPPPTNPVTFVRNHYGCLQGISIEPSTFMETLLTKEFVVLAVGSY
ncbi:hypothetical protein G9A89_000476 [Geosiphon pyriformis]|nr:hypothetical protein G9A89_000476 [Geosiphon pyriformis]